MEFKIYEVIRYNCEHQPADGDDTIFLVRAENHLDAAYLAEQRLSILPHTKVKPFADLIYELGIETRVRSEYYPPQVIRGPYYQAATRCGWKMWWRNAPQDSWVEQDETAFNRPSKL